MAQSHIKITGGLLDGKSMRNTITVSGHTFKAGQALRFNREAATGVPNDFYTPAIADSAANSEVIGVVESVEGSSFVLVYGGEISTANFDSEYALEDDDVFFLSGITAGFVDKIPPSTAGQVIKPVLIRSEGTKAIVTNFIGTVIGGSSVVNLDGIQPVGTIEPYAGQANDVPVTWSLCDGGALSTTAFIDLYNRIGREFGYHVTIQSSAITSGAGIVVGQVVQQGGGITGRIVSIDLALNQITVDVDYLKSTGTIDGFTPHNESFETDLSIPQQVSVSNGVIYAGSLTPKAESDQPSSTITLSSPTVTTTAFRKPDLRGKVVMGSASLTPEGNDQEGTLIVTDRNSPRGSILGEYEHTLTEAELAAHSHEVKETDSDRQHGQVDSTSNPNSPFSVNNSSGAGYKGQQVQSETVGSNESHNNLQPTVAINWIIKTTANAAAAVIDNLTTQIPLTDLTDVSITPSDGDIVMYDASNTPVKFKAYNLLTKYVESANGKGSAEQIFQIDTSAANFTSTFPHVRFGGPDSGRNGFSVNLDGLGSGAPKFEVLNSGNSPLMSLQKTSTTDQTYGIASIGTNGPPEEKANLSLGSKGLLFTNSSSTPVNKILTEVSPSSTATDTNLVTEKAVRDAINDQTTASYTIHLGSGGTAIELFPPWASTRTAGNGVKATVEKVETSSGGLNRVGLKLTVNNNSGSDIVVGGHFASAIFDINNLSSLAQNEGSEQQVSGSFNENVCKTGNSFTKDSNTFVFADANPRSTGMFGVINFRKTTTNESDNELGSLFVDGQSQ